MKASDLYAQLERDFMEPGFTDDWVQYMEEITDFLTERYKKRSMGLVCDFATEITHVYTAVFPSKAVMQKMIDDDVCDAMLFVHHPSVWDIRQNPPFYNMERTLLEEFRRRSISIYNLHVPLDHYGPYSTSVCLAGALDLTITKSFALDCGALAGVVATSGACTIEELRKIFVRAVGHDVALHMYGDGDICGKKIAVVAGGGLTEFVEEVAAEGASVFVTGVTALNAYNQRAHDYAKKHGISLLGGTHYSTEKFACQKMVKYFVAKGLSAEFIADTPIMEDM